MRRVIVVVMGMTMGMFVVSGTGPAIADVGPRIAIHPHVDTATYDKPLHTIRGRVGIVNMTKKAVVIRCTVVATLHAKNGTATISGSSTLRAQVGPGTTRQPHYQIEIRDKRHRFRNNPSGLAAHCSRA